MRRTIAIFYLLAAAFIYSLNLSSTTEVSWVLLILPVSFFVVYYVILGFPNGEYAKKLQRLLDEPSNLVLFSETVESLTQEESDVSRFETLRKIAAQMEGRIQPVLKMQKRLFMFSAFVAPVFPMAMAFSEFLLGRRPNVVVLLIAYGAALVVAVFTRIGIRNLFNTLNRLNRELVKMYEEMSGKSRDSQNQE
ncbi:MAG TPA: hypothetical protein DCE14_06925 [Kosmotogaceae bacterium]|nr:MAG: Uncharacterized protein XE05_1919 [Thermotogales bacterium 46_20]HAA86058.1 hypothetical protein [Kosmotogaceae bacterium]